MSDIKIGASETVNHIEAQILDEIISWLVAKTKRGRQQQAISNLSELKKIVKKVQGSLEENEGASIPLAVYYDVNRAVLDVPLKIRTRHEFDQLAAYDKALTADRKDFRLFFEWYRNR